MSVTVITPVAPYHNDRVVQAIDSVKAQTIACHHIVMHDTDGRGAGATRNRALAQVRTPFVVFLDADDWIEPTFIERTLAAHQPRGYVYTSWWGAKGIVTPEPACWCGDGSWHVITTLLPTEAVRAVGGFDEAMPGGEDTDFYWKLTRSGWYGIHVNEPLFHYGDGGQRSQTFIERDDYPQIMNTMMHRYRGRVAWGCKDKSMMTIQPANTRQDGDVLCIANWQGNRKVYGRATGRAYPRTGNHRQLYVARADMLASNGDFTPVPQETVKKDGLVKLRNALWRNVSPHTQYRSISPSGVQLKSDVKRILELYHG